MVTIYDLVVAAEWLDNNEGEAREQESCQRVAEWIRRQIDRREKEAVVKEVSRKTGAGPASVRRKMKETK